MHRACKISLKHITASKRSKIAALLESYRAAVNFYVPSLWETPGKLDKATLDRLPLERTRLSARYRSASQKQALEIVVSTKLAAKATSKWIGHPPRFKGAAKLDAKFVTIEPSTCIDFDLCITLSILKKGSRIVLPLKETKILREWLKKPGAQLVQGCMLSEDFIIVWVKIPDGELRTEGKVLGVDVGVHKIISDSDGKFYGREFKDIREKIKRKVKGSKAHKRSLIERDHYMNRQVNQLPWDELKAIGVENLKRMKEGKKKGFNAFKPFRKAMVPWTYRRVSTRIEQRAQENRVRLVRVNPKNTSRRCSNCGTVSESARKGEYYACAICNYTADADTNGARNVLEDTLQALRSFDSIESMQSLGPNESVPDVLCHE